jgi:hypothetical protein
LRTTLLLILSLVWSLTCVAQKTAVQYQPKNMDSIRNYIGAITTKKAKSFTGNNQKEIQKILNERKESFLKTIKDSGYIFDARIDKYLKSITAEIYRANPEIAHTDHYFFIDKSPIPNAACYGNGIFTVNLGLFTMVQSDDELAFTICHEMAHEKLSHSDKSLLDHLSTMKAKETKKQMRKAGNQTYGRRKALSELSRTLSYNFMKRSRNAETQADSLGFKFFSKTKFNKAAATQSLKKLGMVDTLFFNVDPQIRKHFTFSDYPFKEGWLAKDETLFDLKEKSDDYAFDKDSLKSHPDIPFRIAKLEKMSSGNDIAPQSPKLAEIKKIASELCIASAIDESRLDVALYEVLSLSERNEIDVKAYYSNMAYLLKRTYELKQNHQFGKYVSPPNPFSEEKFLDEIRLFLHNTELKNLRKIGLRFCQKYQPEMGSDPDFNSITAFFKNLNPSQ